MRVLSFSERNSNKSVEKWERQTRGGFIRGGNSQIRFSKRKCSLVDEGLSNGRAIQKRSKDIRVGTSLISSKVKRNRKCSCLFGH